MRGTVAEVQGSFDLITASSTMESGAERVSVGRNHKVEAVRIGVRAITLMYCSIAPLKSRLME